MSANGLRRQGGLVIFQEDVRQPVNAAQKRRAQVVRDGVGEGRPVLCWRLPVLRARARTRFQLRVRGADGGFGAFALGQFFLQRGESRVFDGDGDQARLPPSQSRSPQVRAFSVISLGLEAASGTSPLTESQSGNGHHRSRDPGHIPQHGAALAGRPAAGRFLRRCGSPGTPRRSG